MTNLERRSVLAIGSLYILRMLGLFMVLPIMTVLGSGYPGATPVLVGLALGVYGLTQALLQIPMGLASDKFGRRPIIAIGLLLFLLGSIIAATAVDIYALIVGRGLQGAGAIAAALMALLADVTHERSRSKAMAVIGASIGVAFALSVVLGPLLSSFWGLSGLFWLTAALTAIGLVITFTYLPVPSSQVRSNPSGVIKPLQEVLVHGQLMRLNIGVFVLHGALTALFVVLPLRLIDQANLPVASHWQVYLPVMVIAFVLMVPPMILAEKRGRMKLVFLTAVGMIALAQVAFFAGPTTGAVSLIATVFLFFVAFNLLEATMPSMMSKLSPPHAKGAASGVYATFQFAGAFVGGLVGGWLYQTSGAEAVYLACAGAIAVWLLAAVSMRVPQANQTVQVAITRAQYEQMKNALLALDGVYEITYSLDLAAVDLRVDRHTFQISQLQALGLQPGA